LRACLASVALLLLGACGALASPFDQVPSGDSGYADCAFLAQCGIIDARPAEEYAGTALLTRYDFTVSLVRPMAALEALAREGRLGAALDATGRMSDADRARVSDALLRLLREFGDVFSMLGKDASQAILGARLLAGGERASAPSDAGDSGSAGMSYGDARTRVGVLYRAGEGEAASLPHVPLGGLTDAPLSGPGSSRLPAGRAYMDTAAPDAIASTDISLRRLLGTVEYGVTDNLTLNLAYESMVREGRGTVLLDAASLRTLGIGYRLSPSASLKLSYHLISYADHTGIGSRLEDRMAAGELTVRF
jgi:hypothetical protein